MTARPATGAVRAFLTPEHERAAEEVSAWAEWLEHGPGATAHTDGEAREAAREICAALAEAGWLDPIRREDFRLCALIRESLSYRSPLADAVWALQALSSMPILLAADPGSAPHAWARRALEGAAIGAFAITEPDAGSDVASLQTTARRDRSDYVLDGRKTLISNAGLADFYTTLAVTDPGARHRGISAFVVPADTDGFRFVGAQVLSDPHPLGEVEFEECRVPESARLGEEGDGFRLAMATLDRLRPTVGAAACGMAARALDEAVEHAKSRVQFGKPLAAIGGIQEKLGRMATDLTAARLLVYRATWERDGGAGRTDIEAAMAKSFATETAHQVIDDAVQILGGRGVLAEGVVDRMYRAVRALRIYEGSTEIQRIIVARDLVSEGPR